MKFLRQAGSITLKRLFILGAAALALAFYFVDSKRYAALVDGILISSGQKNGLFVQIENSDLSIFGYQAETIGLRPRKSLWGLKIDTLSARPALSALLSGQWGVHLDGMVYGGELDAAIQGSFSGDNVSGNLNLTQCNAATYPLLEGLGFRKGSVDLQAKEFVISQNQLHSGQFQVQISQFEKPESSSLSLDSFGVPLEFQLPEIRDLNGEIVCTLKQPENLSCVLKAAAQLAQIDGNFDFQMKQGQLLRIKAQGKAALLSVGVDTFAKYLPLISGGRLKEGDTSFRFDIQGSPRAPRIVLDPLAPGENIVNTPQKG